MERNESGDWELSIGEVERYSPAAEACIELLGERIDLTRPISHGEWFNLIMARVWLEDGAEGIKTLVNLMDKEIELRKVPH
jgi:hypothetical protein